MIVPLPEVLEFLGVASTSTTVVSITGMHKAIETWVKNRCRRGLEVASYKEQYDGDGGEQIFLRQSPLISIERLMLDRLDVVAIRNDNRVSTASVSVNNTGLVLRYNNVSDSTILFAAYPTIGAVVGAVNAKGNGWFAAIQSNEYSDYLSTELLPQYGLNCIWGQVEYLNIPYYQYLYPYVVYPEEGYIWMTGGWPKGQRNIFIDYTAGYNPIPDDLKYAVNLIIQKLNRDKNYQMFGLSSYRLGDLSLSFDNYIDRIIPPESASTLWYYRRILV